MSEPKIAYVTKYALSGGIAVREIIRADEDGYAVVRWPGGLNGQFGIGKGDWSPTLQAAIARAEAMRVAKIASLKKQIAKLEKLEFSIPQAPSV
ncbi:hypothetical protein [Methylobacterium bullatum]|uniref:Uncharacterized protein n=1 Tax=Methylobacterium bullatum TaxID=570505 RepID=A0AAV4ZCD5_9HYPH|nr:hypothetical protein [Methylobacterium bullatum]MBD8902803.1 hypothetical protein [Methylobacterium bullatum]GJD41289.1 hypothetical protein OICFNHDK_3772 [Methylobacterium bullatum]